VAKAKLDLRAREVVSPPLVTFGERNGGEGFTWGMERKEEEELKGGR
jgi:hypothetical protein